MSSDIEDWQGEPTEPIVAWRILNGVTESALASSDLKERGFFKRIRFAYQRWRIRLCLKRMREAIEEEGA